MKTKRLLTLRIILFMCLISFMLYCLMSEYKFFNNLIPTIIIYGSFILFIVIQIISYQRYHYIEKELIQNDNIKKVLLNLAQATTTIENKQEFFDLLLKCAVDVVEDADKGSMMVLDKDNYLSYVSTVGFDFELLSQIRFRIEDTFLYKITNGNIKDTLVIWDTKDFNKGNLNDRDLEILEKVGTSQIRSTISAPIFIDNVLYGMINIDSRKKEAFKHKDISLIEYFSIEASKMIKMHMNVNKLVKYARYDYLTDIYNRQYFDKCMYEIIKKNDEKLRFTLVSLDINGLKWVNDNYGHICGDDLLVQFCTITKKHIKNNDLFARYGGDEFIIALFDKDCIETTAFLKTIMNELARHPISIEDSLLPITFSYGIAEYKKDATSFKDLYAFADNKMYKYKNQFKKNLDSRFRDDVHKDES